jgi:hypothetical protein
LPAFALARSSLPHFNNNNNNNIIIIIIINIINIAQRAMADSEAAEASASVSVDLSRVKERAATASPRRDLTPKIAKAVVFKTAVQKLCAFLLLFTVIPLLGLKTLSPCY